MNREHTKTTIDVSVVLPAHNEESNIGPLLDDFAQIIRRSRSSFEVIVVDDGSTDRTLPRLVEAQRNHRFVRIVSIPRRRGLTEALQAGFAVARGTIVVFYPADRQFHPNDIPKMIDKVREGYDLVTGRKIGQYNKRVVSSIYSRISRVLFPSIPVTDLNSVKAFRRELIDVFDYRHDWHRFWVAIVAEAGYRIGEVDVTLYKRPSGRSKFGYWRIPGAVLDLLAVKFQYHTMRRPLWYFGMTGSILLGLGVLIGGWALYQRFVLEHGYRPLLYLVMTLGISGIVFFSLGFLAESVAGIRQQLDALGSGRKYNLYHPPSGGSSRYPSRTTSRTTSRSESAAPARKPEKQTESRSRRPNGERRRVPSDHRRTTRKRSPNGDQAAKPPVSSAPAKSDNAPSETSDTTGVSKAASAPDAFWTGTALPRRPLDIPDPDLFTGNDKTASGDGKTLESSRPADREATRDKPSESESSSPANADESMEKPVAEREKPPSYGRRRRR